VWVEVLDVSDETATVELTKEQLDAVSNAVREYYVENGGDTLEDAYVELRNAIDRCDE